MSDIKPQSDTNKPGNPNVIVWTYLHAFRITDEYEQNGETLERTLTFAFKNGFPRIIVYPRRYNPTLGNEMYIIPMDIQMMKVLGEVIEYSTKVDFSGKYDIECYNIDYDSPDKKKTKLTGVISVTREAPFTKLIVTVDGTTHEFRIRVPGKWFQVKKDGVLITDTEQVISAYTKQYAKSLYTLADNYLLLYASKYSTNEREPFKH